MEMSAGETCMWKRRASRQCERKQEKLSGGRFLKFFILSSFFLFLKYKRVFLMESTDEVGVAD